MKNSNGMRNSKWLTVAKREYLQRVRSKGFVIMTAAMPLLLFGYVMLMAALARAGGDEQARIAIIDLSGGAVAATLSDTLAHEKLKNGSPRFVVTIESATPQSWPRLHQQLVESVRAERSDGYLLIPVDVLSANRAEYHARTVTNFALARALEQGLHESVSRVRLRKLGIPAGSLEAALADFDMTSVRIGKSGERQDSGQTFIIAYIIGGLLYGVLIGYGVSFMRSVVEEKTSRVAEVMLSSLDAYSLLKGKLLGVAGAGFTQVLVWALCLAAVTTYGVVMSGGGMLASLPHLGVAVYIALIAFFVLGFLVYGALYAAAGAIVGNENETQQTQLPITLLLVAAFVLAQLVLSNPSGPLAVTLSEIPFFAPVLMTMRMVVITPAWWQVALAIALMVVTVMVILKVTAKIYRLGLLMTGKRPTAPELLRWLRYA